MSEWIRKTIGEICDAGGGEVKTGPFGSQLHQSDYTAEGIPVVMPANILNGKIEENGIARVPAKHVERLRKHKLSPGDIIYGRRGDIGRQALIDESNEGWLCGTGCLRIRLGSAEVLPGFLHRYLATEEVIGWIQAQAIGATMPNLNTSILRRVPVFFPSNTITQRKIAAILSAYDDLIENNKRRIALLERMAEELYREWFVRLRFPGHEDTRIVKGVPEGWEEIPFGEFCMLKRGYDLPNAQIVSGSFPVIASTSIKAYHNQYKVEPPVVTTGRSGSLGHVLLVNQKAWPLNTSLYVKDFHGNSPLLVYYTLKSMQLENFNAGAGVPTLNRNHLNGIKMIVPPKRLQLRFQEATEQFVCRKSQLEKENELLTQIRNLLLPRLISGKLRVEDVAIHLPPSMMDAAPPGASPHGVPSQGELFHA